MHAVNREPWKTLLAGRTWYPKKPYTGRERYLFKCTYGPSEEYGTTFDSMVVVNVETNEIVYRHWRRDMGPVYTQYNYELARMKAHAAEAMHNAIGPRRECIRQEWDL